jgi:antitoxin ParD1/3/4
VKVGFEPISTPAQFVTIQPKSMTYLQPAYQSGPIRHSVFDTLSTHQQPATAKRALHTNLCKRLVIIPRTKPTGVDFGKNWQEAYPMSTMNISLPDTLKSFVDEQVNQRGYGTSSEYVRELIRKDQDRQHLRGLLLAGAASAPAAPADADYFESLRTRVRNAQG